MKKKLLALSAALLGLGLTGLGLFLGQNAAVFAKAARVCLECVGLG